MFQKKTGYPKLKGRAADIYGLAPAMWELFTQHIDADDPQHKLIQLFLKLNITPHNVLEEFHPRASFLAIPREQSGPLYTYGLQMAQLHVQLSDFYSSHDKRLFNITNKTHAYLHVLQLSRFIHPSLVW